MKLKKWLVVCVCVVLLLRIIPFSVSAQGGSNDAVAAVTGYDTNGRIVFTYVEAEDDGTMARLLRQMRAFVCSMP